MSVPVMRHPELCAGQARVQHTGMSRSWAAMMHTLTLGWQALLQPPCTFSGPCRLLPCHAMPWPPGACLQQPPVVEARLQQEQRPRIPPLQLLQLRHSGNAE